MKKFTHYIFVFLIGLLLSCNNGKNSGNSTEIPQEDLMTLTFDSATNEDYQIINSTLVHLVNPDPPGYKRKFGYNNFDYERQNGNP